MSNFYDRVNWKDYPDTDTPITAENLNKMDAGIYDISTDIGDMDLIADSGDGTICQNLSNALGIKVYVGTDGKLHFVDGAGADSVLDFSKDWHMTINIEINAFLKDIYVGAFGNARAKITCKNGNISTSLLSNGECEGAKYYGTEGVWAVGRVVSVRLISFAYD